MMFLTATSLPLLVALAEIGLRNGTMLRENAAALVGVNLAKATDLLDERYGLGEALGGMILLSVAGSLPWCHAP
jgi:hypothetical protein